MGQNWRFFASRIIVRIKIISLFSLECKIFGQNCREWLLELDFWKVKPSISFLLSSSQPWRFHMSKEIYKIHGRFFFCHGFLFLRVLFFVVCAAVFSVKNWTDEKCHNIFQLCFFLYSISFHSPTTREVFLSRSHLIAFLFLKNIVVYTFKLLCLSKAWPAEHAKSIPQFGIHVCDI